MADTLIDWVDGINTVGAFSTPPVTSSEEGITPAIGTALPFPPPYQPTPTPFGHTPGAEAGDPSGAFDEEVIFGNLPTPPGPVAPPPVLLNANGFLCPGHVADMYGRIHLIPLSVDLGNVLQDTVQLVEVWNAFFTPQTLATITPAGNTGITLAQPTPPGVPPALFPETSSFIYEFTITPDGPAAILATYEFDFTVDAPVFTITGARVVTLAWCPERPIKEVLEWHTDILEVFDGDEYRIQVRQFPRQQFDYKYLITDERSAATFRNNVIGQAGRSFAVPIWTFGRPLLQDAVITDQTIFLDTTNADFRESTADKAELVILWRSEFDFEIAQVGIGGILPDRIVLERPLEQNHDALVTDVLPMQIMLAKDPIKWSMTETNVMTANTQWLSEDVADLAEIDGNLTIFDGLPVLTGFNFIDTTLEEKVARKYDLFDTESGVFQAIFGRTIPEFASKKGFETQTSADSWDLRKLLYALRGKQRSFWFPTFRNDFVLQDATITAAAANFSSEPVDYERFIAEQEPFAAIMFLLNDGTQFFRTITGVTFDATGGPSGQPTEIVSFSPPLGVTVPASDLRYISYLVRSRLGSDKIGITHARKDNLSIRVPVIGVKQ